MTSKKPFLALLFCGSFLLFSCDEEKEEEKEVATTPVEFTKDAEVLLLKAAGDTIKRLDVEISDNDYERETGLMYRKNLEETQAMIFVFPDEQPRSFYMKNTHIPLDIIYFSSDSTIVSIQKNAQPRNEAGLPSEGPAQFVLEVKAGLSDQWSLEKGDKFLLADD